MGGRCSYSDTDMCPKCNTELRFRGKEKKASKFRYYRYEVFCPQCGEIYSFSDGKARRYSHLGRMLGRHAGEIGEKFAQNFLIDEGYEIRDFTGLASDILCEDESKGQMMIYRGSAKLFLADRYKSFIAFCQAWNQESSVQSTVTSHKVNGRDEEETFSPHLAGLDYVGKKDGEFYLIEAKTNTAVLQNYQKKMMLKAEDFGFIPLVIRVKVDVNVPLDEVRIEKLE